MEPDLWELFEYGEADDEVAAIIRLGHYGTVPQGVRVVAQFEDIITVRLSRRDIPKISSAPEVSGMSAGDTYVGPDLELDSVEAGNVPPTTAIATDTRRPEGLGMTGRGIVVGVVDWGFDFAHPDFRRADGTTRILALWDQRGGKRPDSPQPFGYGVVHTREDINRALKENDPYAALKYHPADSDTGFGCHGTHVLSIAAGSGGDERPTGIAPEADLVVVHNAPWDGLESGKLGDSVTLLEGIEFISRTAAGNPWVINLSMGRHGEQHDGSTLVELGFDAAVRSAPGRAVVLSTGNYFNKHIHASGQLRPTEERTFAWVINSGKPSDYNQLEVWYSWQDKFEVMVRSPDGAITARARLGEKVKLLSGGKEVGNVYHRAQEPNTLDHHITIFLYKTAPGGEWDITITGTDVIHGDYHAWIEREVSCPACQSHFKAEDADPRSTTGTICNGRRTLAIGAYDAHDPGRRIGPFSSVGPTRDGRLKPDLCAPGMQVLAARSAPRKGADTAPLLTRMSGTSMAAPHVTGTVALMFQAAVKPLRIEETHNLLLGNAERVSIPEDNPDRVGIGFLDVEAAVEAAGGVDRANRTFKPVPAKAVAGISIPKKPMLAQAESGERYVSRDSSEALALAAASLIDEGESVGRQHTAGAVAMPVDALSITEAEIPTAAPVMHPELRRGATGAAVRDAQLKLNAYHAAEMAAGRAGLPGGAFTPDGIFGPAMSAATRAFQQHMFPNDPVAADGIIGPKTWAVLDRVAFAPAPSGEPQPPALSPNTAPEYWFLDAAEILAACGQSETRRRLSTFTSKNLVQPLVDGEEFMKALHDDLALTRSGDFFHLTAWRLNIAQDLVPSPGGGVKPSQFGALLAAIAGRGVQTRALIFKAVAGGYATSSLGAQVRENTEARNWFNSIGGRGVIDGRYPILGSHHQKSAILKRANEAVAYCGGIDIAPDRWDTSQHDSDTRRTPETYAGWHDVHLRVRGPAVLDIEMNFRDRWNARDEWPSWVPPEPPPPVITDPLPAVAKDPGTHHVQVLRTFACTRDHFRDFAPGGEITCRAAYLKAISRAQNYIYIEDQYLVSQDLADALDKALDRIDKLLILVPAAADSPPVEAWNFHQERFLRTVAARHPGKVCVFHPVQPKTGHPIYVHSKVMIVDDVFAVVGSPNVNRRSMTYDTELAAAVVDANLVDGVCRYARDLRLQLWSEHLNLSAGDPVLINPVTGIREWERQAAVGTLRVRRHVTPGPQDELAPIWDKAVDPDGRCGTPAKGESEIAIRETDSFSELVELADEIVAARPGVESGPLLHEWFERQGAGEALRRAGRHPLGAAELFDQIVYASGSRPDSPLSQHLEVIAAPCAVLARELQPGDMLLRRAEGRSAHLAIIASPNLRTLEDVLADGHIPEQRAAGQYVLVIEGGARPHRQEDGFTRRVLDEYGRVPRDQVVLRRKVTSEPGESIGPTGLLVGLTLASSLNRPAPPPPQVTVNVTPDPTAEKVTSEPGESISPTGLLVGLTLASSLNRPAPPPPQITVDVTRDPTAEGVAEQVATVGPFADQAYGPQMINDAQRTATLVSAIANVKATLSVADQRRLDRVAFAIAKLGTGANPVPYAGLRENDMMFSGSLAKYALLFATFELRARVRKLAPLIVAPDPTTATDASKFFAAVHAAFDATIRPLVPWLTPGDWRETQVQQVLATTPNGSGGVDVDLSARHRADVNDVFAKQFSNTAPSRCIRRLGYSYTDGSLAAGGFLGVDRTLDTFKKGIWMANDLGAGWPQFFVPVSTGGTSSMALTCVDLCNLLTAMQRGTLIDTASSQDMMDIVSHGGSWLQFVDADKCPGFTSAGAKVGHASSDDARVPTVKSEGAFINRGGVLFAVVWQNYFDASPPKSADTLNVYRVIDEVTQRWP